MERRQGTRSPTFSDFNPRRAEGLFRHPPQVFGDSRKTEARSATVFGTPLLTSFSHIL